MPSAIVTTAARIMCAHGGQVTLIPKQMKVLAGSAPVLCLGDLVGSPTVAMPANVRQAQRRHREAPANVCPEWVRTRRGVPAGCDDARVLSIDEAHEQWAPEGPYLDTASYGLPPRVGFEALQAALHDWRRGRGIWPRWGESAEGARAAFAEMVGVPVARVSIGATASEFVGLVAASLPDGARVLVPDVEFTSTLWPFLVQEHRGIRVTTLPPALIAQAIDARTDVVAFSAVQMSSGEVADIDAIVAAAAHHGATTVLDATQAAGWLPIDGARFGAVVCGAYKWLMSPRGTAFMVVGEALQEAMVPHSAGWYAGQDVHASYFGPPLRLASDARRYDTSPAWFSWVGTKPAIELINRIGVGSVYEHDVALANRFLAGLGMGPSNSAIVTVDLPDAAARLERTGIAAAVRGGRLRVSCHLYNSDADVDAALDALCG